MAAGQMDLTLSQSYRCVTFHGIENNKIFNELVRVIILNKTFELPRLYSNSKLKLVCCCFITTCVCIYYPINFKR
jgi:hypothetical protein